MGSKSYLWAKDEKQHECAEKYKLILINFGKVDGLTKYVMFLVSVPRILMVGWFGVLDPREHLIFFTGRTGHGRTSSKIGRSNFVEIVVLCQFFYNWREVI